MRWKGRYLWRMILDLRSVQRPLKKKYRDEPGSSRITLEAKASQQDTPISCSVDVGRAIYEAGAHAGVGGTGTAACSGDLLLGALAACAQVTCQMVAEAMGIETERLQGRPRRLRDHQYQLRCSGAAGYGRAVG